MERIASSSSRDFGATIGLGGLNQDKIQAKLQKRNRQAPMATSTTNIAKEQETRISSIQNTIMNNQIALSAVQKQIY